MQAIWTSPKYSMRSSVSVSTSLLLALGICVCGVARAQVPTSANVILTQQTELGALPSGGGESGQVPAGDDMAVNSNGDVIVGNTYGSEVLLYSAQGGMPTVLGSPGANPAGMAVDSQNNLYVALATSTAVLKVPYVNGAYVAMGAPAGGNPYPAGTPNCTGTDTVECIMSNLTTNGSGVISLTFDSKGDLFYGTANIGNEGGATSPNSIWECTAACLYTGTPAPTKLFTEPTSATPTTTGQLNIGGLAVDPYGNLFFTDSAVNSTGSSNQESFASNLNELVYTSGTGFAATPTVIYSYAPSTPSDYDAEINGVVTDANGTVYTLLQNTGGILAFPNNHGVINAMGKYLVSTVTGKLLGIDTQGNFYADTYISGDAIVRIGFNNLVATASAVAAPSTATFTAILNDGGCTPTPMITYTTSGTAGSAFSAVTTGTCSSTFTGGASLGGTLTFTPTAVGTSSATLTAADTNGNSGTAAISGNGTGTVATPAFSVAGGSYTAAQTVSITDATLGASIYYTTDGSTPAANAGTSTLYSGPITVAVSETLNAIAVDSGDTNSAVASATYTITLPGAAATPTLSPAGTFTTPQSVSISDATTGAAIYYTTDGSAPTASSNLYIGPIVVSQTETVNAIAVASGFSNSAVATALYTIDLPASAFQNIVMTQSTSYGALGSGGSQAGSVPDGASMAVNSLGDVIAGNTYGNLIQIFTPQGGTPTTLGAVTNPNGVAVDSQNNLYIGFSYTSAVVKVPFVNGAYATLAAAPNDPPYPAGTPNCTGNDTVECVMSNVAAGGADILSMIFDSKGDMFYSSGLSGGTNNAIFECSTACLYTGTPAPTQIFQEPTSGTPTTTGQLDLGGLALDAAGDLFFTDSAVNSTTSQESYSSNLNELVYTSGTGYATTPTVIYTYTPTAVGQYGPEIDGVAVTPNNTVYALLEGATGILAFPKVSGAYSSTTMYLVSTQQGKTMTSDGFGNLYIADDGGTIYQVAVDSLTAPTTPQGNPSNATNITTLLNDGGCTTTPPTVTFAATGTSAASFSAVTTGSCASTPTGGASYGTTLTFTPTSTGTNSATLTATDSLSNTGVATVVGTGTPAPPAATPTFSVPAGTYTTVQTVTIADTTTGAVIYYTTDGSTPTSTSAVYSAPLSVSTTETLSAIALAPGFAGSPVATALYTVNLPTAATPSFSVTAGTYTTVQTVSITDATTGAVIYYTTDGSTPTPGSGTAAVYSTGILVPTSLTIKAVAVAPNYINSAVATAAYVINLPTPGFTIVATSATVTASPGGSGTTTLTITANAAFNGTIAFSCSGFVPAGATCAFSPANVTVAALASSPTTLTVTVPAKPVIADMRQGSGPLYAGIVGAGVLCLIGLRKRRGLQMLMMLIVSAVGLSMFSGCTTTSSASPSSSQMVVTASGKSCPVNEPGCTQDASQATASVDLVLTVP
jgi:hypothetical protein